MIIFPGCVQVSGGMRLQGFGSLVELLWFLLLVVQMESLATQNMVLKRLMAQR